jgi:hypothetical protein
VSHLVSVLCHVLRSGGRGALSFRKQFPAIMQ